MILQENLKISFMKKFVSYFSIEKIIYLLIGGAFLVGFYKNILTNIDDRVCILENKVYTNENKMERLENDVSWIKTTLSRIENKIDERRK